MRRENIQSKLLFGLCVLVGLCGCNSFLDVQPKGTVEQGKQFKDVRGIETPCMAFMPRWHKQACTGKR